MVTSLRSGRRGKVKLVIEGREPIEVSRQTIIAYSLHEGDVLLETDVRRVLDEEERQEARSRALRFLEARERSCQEVRNRLRRYGYGDSVVDGTLAHLAGLGFVDDRRFALTYAREKFRTGWGPRRIQDELGRKGIARPLAAEVLAELSEAQGEAFSGALEQTDSPKSADLGPDLVALAERKFGRELRTDRQRGERRVAGFLARRGHEWGRIDQVIRELRSRNPAESDEDCS